MKFHLIHHANRVSVTYGEFIICEVDLSTTIEEFDEMFKAFQKMYSLGYMEGKKDKQNETQLQTQ